MMKNKICCIYVNQEYFNTFIHEVVCTVNLIESKCSTTVSYVQQMTYIICISLLFFILFHIIFNLLHIIRWVKCIILVSAQKN